VQGLPAGRVRRVEWELELQPVRGGHVRGGIRAERVPALPKPAAQWKVLPALNNSLEFGGGSARAQLTLRPTLAAWSVRCC
jgi:hypothetical protein